MGNHKTKARGTLNETWSNQRKAVYSSQFIHSLQNKTTTLQWHKRISAYFSEAEMEYCGLR